VSDCICYWERYTLFTSDRIFVCVTFLLNFYFSYSFTFCIHIIIVYSFKHPKNWPNNIMIDQIWSIKLLNFDQLLIDHHCSSIACSARSLTRTDQWSIMIDSIKFTTHDTYSSSHLLQAIILQLNFNTCYKKNILRIIVTYDLFESW